MSTGLALIWNLKRFLEQVVLHSRWYVYAILWFHCLIILASLLVGLVQCKQTVNRWMSTRKSLLWLGF